jgi:hypothetical protein
MFTLVRLKDPEGVLGKEMSSHEHGKQLAEFLHDDVEGFNHVDYVVLKNGVLISFPEFDEDGNMTKRGSEDELTSEIKDGDIIHVVRTQGDPATLIYIAISVAVSLAVTLLMVPDTPQVSTDGNNNVINGQTNAARLYQAIPDIYGTINAFPDLITSEATKSYNNNTNGADITQHMCIGMGYYDFQTSDVKLGNTRIESISGSNVEVYKPLNGVTTIPNFESHYSAPEIEGQPLLYETETYIPEKIGFIANVQNVSGDILINNTNNLTSYLNGTEVTITGGHVGIENDGLSLDGLYTVISTTSNSIQLRPVNPIPEIEQVQGNPVFNSSLIAAGNNAETVVGPFDSGIEGDNLIFDLAYTRGIDVPDNSIVHIITVQEIDGPSGNTIGLKRSLIFADSSNLKDDDFGRQNRSYTFDPSIFGLEKKRFFRFTVVRVSEISDEADEPSTAQLERVAVVNTYDQIELENVTAIKVDIPQTASALSPRENKVNVEVTRKTVSRSASGNTPESGLTPSRKFADAILHEYVEVFGRSSSELDLDSLYEIQDSLDDGITQGLGDFSFTFDDLEMSLAERLSTICNCCRVKTYMDGGVWRFTREEATDLRAGIITKRDIAKDREYSRGWKSQLPNGYDGVKLEYLDPKTNKKAFLYRKFDSEGKVVDGRSKNPKEVTLSGCRNYNQAVNRAELECRRIVSEYWTVKDTLMQQGNLYDIGDIVEYADVYREDIYSGEIVGINGGTMYLSEDINLDPLKTYEMVFNDVTGSPEEPVEVTQTGDKQVQTSGNIDSAFYREPGENQLGSRFIISELTESKPETFFVTAKEPSGRNVNLTLSEYSEKLFEFDNLPIFDFKTLPIYLGTSASSVGGDISIIAASNDMSENFRDYDDYVFALNDGYSCGYDESFVSLNEYQKGFLTPFDGVNPTCIANYVQYIFVGFEKGYACMSSDGGATFTELPRFLNSGHTGYTAPPSESGKVLSVAINGDTLTSVRTIVYGFDNGYGSISTDSGVTFSALTFPVGFTGDLADCAMNNSASVICFAGGEFGSVLISTDGGTSFSVFDGSDIGLVNGTSNVCYSVDIARETGRIIAGFSDGQIAYTDDYGLNWTILEDYFGKAPEDTTFGHFSQMNISDDGKTIFAGTFDGYLYISANEGSDAILYNRYIDSGARNGATLTSTAMNKNTALSFFAGFSDGTASATIV